MHYDRAAILDELMAAKAAMLALTQIPYQRSWADELQKMELKREVAGTSRIEGLTDREFEIYGLIGQGLSTRDIAKQLHLSAKTVEVHRLNIKTKLKLTTASELIHHAVRWMQSQAPGSV